jgi:hypothetical protein
MFVWFGGNAPTASAMLANVADGSWFVLRETAAWAA